MPRAPSGRRLCGLCRPSSSSSVLRSHTPSPKIRSKTARSTRWDARAHTRVHARAGSRALSGLQKQFLDSLRKALSGQGGSKQLMESAAIACVKLCKASTYISWEDHSTIFLLVQSIVMDLKVCTSLLGCERRQQRRFFSQANVPPQALLFNPSKPFWRGTGSQNADVELMMDCFVSCFRITPHNNQHFKVTGAVGAAGAPSAGLEPAASSFLSSAGLPGLVLPLHLSLCPGQLFAQNHHQRKCAGPAAAAATTACGECLRLISVLLSVPPGLVAKD